MKYKVFLLLVAFYRLWHGHLSASSPIVMGRNDIGLPGNT